MVGILGILGNTLAILVLQSRHTDMKVTRGFLMSSSIFSKRNFRAILTLLAGFDGLLVTTILINFSLPHFSPHWKVGGSSQSRPHFSSFQIMVQTHKL